MARRGDEGKKIVTDTIARAFGGNYLGVFDKKLIVQAEESGEMIQYAIAISMPKNAVAAPTGENADANIEISEQDEKKIAELMKTLGIENE